MDKATERLRNTYYVGNLTLLVLDVGREMIEQIGPAKLSIRAISEKVSVSATAIYHHFANRLDLLSHLVSQGFQELEKALHVCKLLTFLLNGLNINIFNKYMNLYFLVSEI